MELRLLIVTIEEMFYETISRVPTVNHLSLIKTFNEIITFKVFIY